MKNEGNIYNIHFLNNDAQIIDFIKTKLFSIK